MIPPKYWSPTKKLMVLGAMAGGKTVEDTATGNPLTFITDVSKPLKSLLIPFTPVQSGTGDPSSQNIRSILPWNGLKVWNGGKNLFNSADGIELTANMIRFARTRGYGVPFPMKKGFTYTVSINSQERNPSEWQIQKPFTGVSLKTVYGVTKITYTPDEDVEVAVMAYWQSGGRPEAVTDFQIEIGSVASAFEEYKPITETDIAFPSPVYGGTLDVVSGVLTVEYAIVDASDLTWNNTNQSAIGVFRANLPTARNLDDMFNVYSDKYKNGDASKSIAYMDDNTIKGYNGEQYQDYVYIRDGRYTDVADFTQELDCEICYELATPQEITLTPEQITAIVGDNTIWSDADGSMTAVYLKKG